MKRFTGAAPVAIVCKEFGRIRERKIVMNGGQKHLRIGLLAISLFASPVAMSDVVTDWNITLGDIISDAKLPPQPCNRILAIVHTAMYEATNAITKRYPASGLKIEAAPGASLDAAIAAANHAALLKLLPAQQVAIDSAYQAALAKVADGAGKSAGIAVGEQAAAAVLASRTEDNPADTYRPYTSAGVYVPTVIPSAVQWPQRKPWLM